MVPIQMTTPSSPDTGPRPHARLDLSRPDIGFSAAHFSVVGGRAERLHGHNYRVSLSASGDVGDDGALVDFAVLKRALRAECAELDERTLLPLTSESVRVEVEAEVVSVRERSRRFMFPRDDVVLLPIPNTTCEWLAAHLLARLRARLGDLGLRLTLTVEEVPGQSATVTE